MSNIGTLSHETHYLWVVGFTISTIFPTLTLNSPLFLALLLSLSLSLAVALSRALFLSLFFLVALSNRHTSVNSRPSCGDSVRAWLGTEDRLCVVYPPQGLCDSIPQNKPLNPFSPCKTTDTILDHIEDRDHQPWCPHSPPLTHLLPHSLWAQVVPFL